MAMDSNESTTAIAARLFPDPTGGSPPGDGSVNAYEPVLTEVFDGLEYKARFDGDEQEIAELRQDKRNLGRAFASLKVGAGAAQELLALVRDYNENPRDEKNAEAERSRTVEVLKDAWGDDADRMARAAQAVVSRIDSYVPGFARFIAGSGAGSNAALLKRLGAIGVARKLV